MHVEGAALVVLMVAVIVGMNVIVIVVVMVVLLLRVVTGVVVLLEGAALAQRPAHQARRIEQIDHAGVPGQRLDRADEPGLHHVADHEMTSASSSAVASEGR